MKEFKYVFQISNKISFEVRYATVGSNDTPYFSTAANLFNRNYSDYEQCGQAQKELLPSKSVARKFFEKWDKFHLGRLQEEKLVELKEDIKELKEKYNYIEKKADSFGSNNYRGNPEVNFSSIVELCQHPTKATVLKRRKKIEKYQFRVLDKRKVGRCNEYIVENIKTGEKAVFSSDWLKEQVNKGIVSNMSISGNSLYSINDKLK